MEFAIKWSLIEHLNVMNHLIHQTSKIKCIKGFYLLGKKTIKMKRIKYWASGNDYFSFFFFCSIGAALSSASAHWDDNMGTWIVNVITSGPNSMKDRNSQLASISCYPACLMKKFVLYTTIWPAQFSCDSSQICMILRCCYF